MAKRMPTLILENFDDMLDFPQKAAAPTPATTVAVRQQIIDLEIAVLEGFPDHETKLPLYTGQRLDDMVESIKLHGVAMPIIVWLTDDARNVIISGHNRTNAARIVGLLTVPAIVRTGLTMEEAEDLFYELSFRQRGIADMTHAQRAMCIAGHYNLIKRQGTRTDLMNELDELLNQHVNGKNETSAGIQTKLRTNEIVGEKYSLNREKIAQYCRLSTLYPPLLALLDNSDKARHISVEAGYHLSFVESDDLQVFIYNLLVEKGHKLDIKKAELLKGHYQKKKLDVMLTEAILSGQKAKITKQKKTIYKLKPTIFKRFFQSQQSVQEVDNIIEKALELYFKIKGEESKAG